MAPLRRRMIEGMAHLSSYGPRRAQKDATWTVGAFVS